MAFSETEFWAAKNDLQKAFQRLVDSGYDLKEGQAITITGPDTDTNSCEPVDGQCACGKSCEWEVEVKLTRLMTKSA